MARWIRYKDLTIEQRFFFHKYVYNKVRIREFPIDVFEFTFEKPNIYHDFAYWRGGRARHRLLADLQYLGGCLAQIRMVKKRFWPRFIRGTFFHFLTIRAFGRFSFAYHKAPAREWNEFVSRCDCVLEGIQKH